MPAEDAQLRSTPGLITRRCTVSDLQVRAHLELGWRLIGPVSMGLRGAGPHSILEWSGFAAPPFPPTQETTSDADGSVPPA